MALFSIKQRKKAYKNIRPWSYFLLFFFFPHCQSTRLHFVRKRNLDLWNWSVSFSNIKFFIHFKSRFRDRRKSTSGLLNAVQVYGSMRLLMLVPKHFPRNPSSCSYFSFCTVLTCLHFCSFLEMLLSWVTWQTKYFELGY